MAKKNGKDTGPALKNIYLTGFMCAGKTSSGRALARRLRRPFLDSDRLLEKEHGASVASLIRKKGLCRFRRMEAALIRDLTGVCGRVIALGGGVYPSRRWGSLLKKTGVTVFLNCPWAELEARLQAARSGRPLLDGPWEKAALRARKLYAKRIGFYRRADIRVATSGLSPVQAAGKIEKMLAGCRDSLQGK